VAPRTGRRGRRAAARLADRSTLRGGNDSALSRAKAAACGRRYWRPQDAPVLPEMVIQHAPCAD
jgi:hypothetical protein